MSNKYIRYVILLDEIPGAQTTRQAVFDHVQHLKALESEGKLVICGPFTDYKGGMVVIKADSIDEARRIAEADPFVKLGLESTKSAPWSFPAQRTITWVLAKTYTSVNDFDIALGIITNNINKLIFEI